MTVTTSVLYPRTPSSKFDMDYYLSTHMPLVQKTWAPLGLLSWEVLSFTKDLQTNDSAHSVQAILRWESEDKARRAVDVNFDEAKTVFGDVPKFSSEQPHFYYGKSEGKQ